jgi:hypothetical protein
MTRRLSFVGTRVTEVFPFCTVCRERPVRIEGGTCRVCCRAASKTTVEILMRVMSWVLWTALSLMGTSCAVQTWIGLNK